MKFPSRVKLGINIDHIATLRQARQETEPDPEAAARVCRQAGADIIVAHLRQDRRHIQDGDIFKLCAMKGGTHLELAPVGSMTALAARAKPESVCLVPERAGEITTEGGLDLVKNRKNVQGAVSRLKKAGIEVSLFVDPTAAAVRAAKGLGADIVELCTTSYCAAKGKNKMRAELERLELAAYLAQELGLEIHAGHGLDYHNVEPVAEIPNMAALNIGFSVIARSVFVGLKAAVTEMKVLIS